MAARRCRTIVDRPPQLLLQIRGDDRVRRIRPLVFLLVGSTLTQEGRGFGLFVPPQNAMARLVSRNSGRRIVTRFESVSGDEQLMELPIVTTTVDDPRLDDQDVDLMYIADPNEYRYSASDWLQNIRSIPRSTILRAIQFPVLTVMVWSTLVSVVYATLKNVAPTLASHMAVHSRLHSFLVSALGLLLVFRTNAAYQRFAEGRQIWERIHSVTRNMSRMVLLYDREMGPTRIKRTLRLLAVFPYLLHHHVQPHCDESVPMEFALAVVSRPEPPPRRRWKKRSTRGASTTQNALDLVVQEIPSNTICWVDQRSLPWNLFPDPVRKLCARTANRPLWICDRLSHEINEVVYTPNFTSRERLTLLSHIDKLSQAIGECERIHNTAVPLNYARHSLRSLTLWLFTLPFALVEDFGWLTGPSCLLAAWLLYGIYQIGYQIEDPFQGSLRLSMLCDAIYRDVMYGTDFMKRRCTAFSETQAERDAWGRLDGG